MSICIIGGEEDDVVVVDDTNNEDDGNFLLLLCICVGGFNTGEFCWNRNPSDEQLMERRMPMSGGRAMVRYCSSMILSWYCMEEQKGDDDVRASIIHTLILATNVRD